LTTSVTRRRKKSEQQEKNLQDELVFLVHIRGATKKKAKEVKVSPTELGISQKGGEKGRWIVRRVPKAANEAGRRRKPKIVTINYNFEVEMGKKKVGG